MKSTGIVRKIDDLGRVVIPVELRRSLSIGDNGPLEIFVDGDKIILQKFQPGCTLCGDKDIKIVAIHDKDICRTCTERIVTTARLDLKS